MMKYIYRRLLWVLSVVTVVGTAAAQEAPSAANEVQSINVAQQAGGVLVKLTLKQPLVAPPSSFSVANPARVAFDFPGTTNAIGRNSQAFNEGGLRSVNFVQTPEKMRVVLNLSHSMTHEVRIDGNSLLISLASTAVDAKEGGRVTHFSDQKMTGSRHASRDVGFRRGKDGEGKVTVDLSDANTGIDIRQQG
ncbi:MAG: type pilus assembly protein PilQ [Pseudomonadota bacterium]|nr:type pilus assembly protein PilQ [Pseudomonadota bacterium]